MDQDYQICDCCGGKMPPPLTWEKRRNEADECDGTVDQNGRCRAWSDGELWSPGDLYDYFTGRPIRPATEGEYEDSLRAAEWDGGVIDVDGQSCYVVD